MMIPSSIDNNSNSNLHEHEPPAKLQESSIHFSIVQNDNMHDDDDINNNGGDTGYDSRGIILPHWKRPYPKQPHWPNDLKRRRWSSSNEEEQPPLVRVVGTKNQSTTARSDTDRVTTTTAKMMSRTEMIQRQWRQQQQNNQSNPRNYTHTPVSAEESTRLNLSYQRDNLTVPTAAVCHPTLYGKISLPRVFSFVSYYRLLGFDHIFLWYHNSVVQHANHTSRGDWEQLQSLPYLTLTEFHPRQVAERYGSSALEYYGQGLVQDWCTSNASFGASYDWVLVVDADEYLWLRHDWNIKEFLQAHADYSYLSFGKWMYTQMSSATVPIPNERDAGFDLDRFAFTDGSYCYGYNGDPICPEWRGRCKVMARPDRHPVFDLHGSMAELKRHDSKHFDASIRDSEAHLKEWKMILKPSLYETSMILRNPNTTYVVSNDVEAGTHFAKESQQLTEDGKILFAWDFGLHDWLVFVASGCGRLYHTPGTASITS